MHKRWALTVLGARSTASILQADWLGRVCTEFFAMNQSGKSPPCNGAVAGICYVGEVFHVFGENQVTLLGATAVGWRTHSTSRCQSRFSFKVMY